MPPCGRAGTATPPPTTSTTPWAGAAGSQAAHGRTSMQRYRKAPDGQQLPPPKTSGPAPLTRLALRRSLTGCESASPPSLARRPCIGGVRAASSSNHAFAHFLAKQSVSDRRQPRERADRRGQARLRKNGRADRRGLGRDRSSSIGPGKANGAGRLDGGSEQIQRSGGGLRGRLGLGGGVASLMSMVSWGSTARTSKQAAPKRHRINARDCLWPSLPVAVTAFGR